MATSDYYCPEWRLASPLDDVRRFYEPEGLIGCEYDGCPARFFLVAGRGERAPFCLDHADVVFGVSR